uniref:Uncharacterized protein n=1 Tax=Glossina austeni TaxID=7395 RepID=A0A1A9UKU7_GLOAU
MTSAFAFLKTSSIASFWRLLSSVLVKLRNVLQEFSAATLVDIKAFKKISTADPTNIAAATTTTITTTVTTTTTTTTTTPTTMKPNDWVVIPVFADIVKLALTGRENCLQRKYHNYRILNIQ